MADGRPGRRKAAAPRRVPVPGQPSVPVNVLLTPEDKEALDRQARREDRSAASVLRRALRDYVASWEPLRGS